MMTETVLPLVLYKSHLAEALGKSARTIDRLNRAGKLPEKLPLPGRPCWSRDALLIWLRNGGRR